jgi:hypothetical protein
MPLLSLMSGRYECHDLAEGIPIRRSSSGGRHEDAEQATNVQSGLPASMPHDERNQDRGHRSAETDAKQIKAASETPETGPPPICDTLV